VRPLPYRLSHAAIRWLSGAAQESNLPTVGLLRLTGFEDRGPTTRYAGKTSLLTLVRHGARQSPAPTGGLM
jgi:hypothetical protein